MKRIVCMTAVNHAGGIPEALYNGQRDKVVEAVRAEAEERVRQAKAEAERERAWAEFQTRKSARLQKRSVEAFVANLDRKPGIMRRMRNAVATGWAFAWVGACRVWEALVTVYVVAWTITFGGAWLEMGENAGMWVYEG